MMLRTDSIKKTSIHIDIGYQDAPFFIVKCDITKKQKKCNTRKEAETIYNNYSK